MIRSLAWKEWREQRAFLFGGLVAAVGLPVVMAVSELAVAGTDSLVAVMENLPVLFAVVLWPVLAAATGARTLAGEGDERTLPFLLSRPVSRVCLWTIKVSMALGAGIAGSLVVAAGFRSLTPVDASLFAERLFVSSLDPLALATGSLLMFAAAVLFSTFLEQPLTAAAGGLATSLLIGAGLLFVGGLLSLHPVRDLGVLAGEAALAAVLLLLGSLAFFARPELVGRAAGRRTWVVGVGAAVTVAGLVVLPAAHVAARVPLDDAWIDPRSVRQAGNTIAVTATAPDGSRSDVWLVRGDGSGAVRLAGPEARVAAVSADGNQVAYVARGGFPGAAGRRGWDLRVVWTVTDGDVDRLVVPDLAAPRRVVFGLPGGPSPGRPAAGPAWLALQDGSHLVVARLDGSRLERVDTVGTPLERAVILAWLDDPTEVLLGASPSFGPAPSLHAYDVESGRIRAIYRGPDRVWIPGGTSPSRAFSHEERAFPPAWWPVIRDVDQPGARSPSAGPVGAGADLGTTVTPVDLRDGKALARLEDVCGIEAVIDLTMLHRHCGTEDLEASEGERSSGGAGGWEIRVAAVAAGGLASDSAQGKVPDDPPAQGEGQDPRLARLSKVAVERELLPGDPSTPLWLSPGRRHVLLWVGGGRRVPEGGDPHPAIVSSDGTRRDLPDGLQPVGWLDGRRALLMRTAEGPRGPRVVEMLAADAPTGGLEPIYPLSARPSAGGS